MVIILKLSSLLFCIIHEEVFMVDEKISKKKLIFFMTQVNHKNFYKISTQLNFCRPSISKIIIEIRYYDNCLVI